MLSALCCMMEPSAVRRGTSADDGESTLAVVPPPCPAPAPAPAPAGKTTIRGRRPASNRLNRILLPLTPSPPLPPVA